MAEPTVEEAQRWVGSRLDEIGGAGVGKIEGVYVDAVTGEPEWLLARIGRFGRHGLVPVRYAAAAAGRVWVPWEREVLRGAPRVEPGQPLDREREAMLSAHYDLQRANELSERPASAPTSRPAG
ncbi:MAG TPA: hypothetical protein VHI33_01945 [Solirubrobacterales bacterium]|jgi:hypothetical protein|nr:hypothetical protein [Solirubrobacterales bacterium]